MCRGIKFYLDFCFKGYDERVAFVVYPSSKKFLYSSIYGWSWLIDKAKWMPVFIPRVFIPYESSKGEKKLSQKRMGLYFGISAQEEEIRNASNQELKMLLSGTEDVLELCGLDKARFSGILEGVFQRRYLRIDNEGTEATVNMIALATLEVKKRENLPEESNIVIIGAGQVGSHLFKEIVSRKFKDNLFLIDVENQADFPLIAKVLEGEPTIIIDCSGPGVLEKHYLKHFKAGFVVLNEVYFHFKSDFVKQLESQGCMMYHIAGTDGETIPPNIEPYGRYIPGCASWKQTSGVGITRITAESKKKQQVA